MYSHYTTLYRMCACATFESSRQSSEIPNDCTVPPRIAAFQADYLRPLFSDQTHLPLSNIINRSFIKDVSQDHVRIDRVAALTTFFINMATVIGPTPPGTGVIIEATFLA